MPYRKVIISCLVVAVFVAVINQFVFAATNNITNDVILDGTLNVLVNIQKYSWPVVTLLMIFALYKYYVTGSEVLADKVQGQKMVLGISIFMVVVQCLPLFYALVVI